MNILLIAFLLFFQTTRYQVESGKVSFISQAPLETIEASSDQLKGLLDAAGSFAFTVPLYSFKGFNSPLQREHFNENYMESDVFPNAVFTGKVIDLPDLGVDGSYTARAKGKFQVHGVEQERIIPIQLIVKEDQIKITSRFQVLLSEHHIAIPMVVYQKISEEIAVTVEAVLVKT